MKNLQQIKDKILKAKKGVYHHMVWKSEDIINGETFTKISEGSVRLCDYYSVAKKPRPEGYVYEVIKTNKKGEEYVQFITTGKSPKVSYYRNGLMVDKEEYESIIPNKGGKIDILFSKHLDKIIAFN